MSSVSIELVDRASVRLQALPNEVRMRLRGVIARDVIQLGNAVKVNVSGPILKIRTGKLLSSIHEELHETPDAIWGVVYSNDIKAAILEWGGQTRPHVIVPVNVKALRFMAGGATVFARRVNHPGSKIPAFAYMRTSLAQLRGQLMADMIESIAA